MTKEEANKMAIILRTFSDGLANGNQFLTVMGKEEMFRSMNFLYENDAFLNPPPIQNTVRFEF